MTSNDDFYFSLLRVSMLQLLKATGFDRARPSTVDIFTDLYIKWLELMLSEVKKMSQARQLPGDSDYVDSSNSNIALQDISQAMVNLGQVKPMDLLDIYDENPNLPSDKGFQMWKQWCLNDVQLQYTKDVSLPPIDLVRFDLNKKIETMANAKKHAGFTIGPTKDAEEGDKQTNNNKITNRVSGAENTTDYLNKIQSASSNGMILDDELQKELLKEDEIIEEIINNGDTDDWIKFVLIRQRLNIWNKKPQNTLPTKTSQLSNIGGLKNSLLNVTLRNNNLEDLETDNNITQTIRSNNDYIPIIPQAILDGLNHDPNNNITTTTNTGVDPSLNDTNNSITEDDIQYAQRAQEYMKRLPAMLKDNRLDNITLSYENDIIESDDDEEEEEDDSEEEDSDEEAIEEDEEDNDIEMPDKPIDNESNHNNGFNNNDINHDQMYPDPIEESSNFQLTGNMNDNTDHEDDDVGNNLDLAAMEDMDNTFQRRQSLDFGNPF